MHENAEQLALSDFIEFPESIILGTIIFGTVLKVAISPGFIGDQLKSRGENVFSSDQKVLSSDQKVLSGDEKLFSSAEKQFSGHEKALFGARK